MSYAIAIAIKIRFTLSNRPRPKNVALVDQTWMHDLRLCTVRNADATRTPQNYIVEPSDVHPDGFALRYFGEMSIKDPKKNPRWLRREIGRQLKKLGFRGNLQNLDVGHAVILTASRSCLTQDKSGPIDGEKHRLFRDKSIRFALRKWGDRIAAIVGHVDERTPHLTVYLLPRAPDLTRSNRSRHPSVMSRKELADLWTEYADALKDLGVVRGVRNSRASHKMIVEFYDALEASFAELPTKVQLPEPRLLQSASSYKEAIEPLLEGTRQMYRKHLIRSAALDDVKAERDLARANIMELQRQLHDLRIENDRQKEIPLAEVLTTLGAFAAPSPTHPNRWLTAKGAMVVENDTFGLICSGQRGQGSLQLTMTLAGFGRDESLAFLKSAFGETKMKAALVGYVFQSLNRDSGPLRERIDSAATPDLPKKAAATHRDALVAHDERQWQSVLAPSGLPAFASLAAKGHVLRSNFDGALAFAHQDPDGHIVGWRLRKSGPDGYEHFVGDTQTHSAFCVGPTTGRLVVVSGEAEALAWHSWRPRDRVAALPASTGSLPWIVAAGRTRPVTLAYFDYDAQETMGRYLRDERLESIRCDLPHAWELPSLTEAPPHATWQEWLGCPPAADPHNIAKDWLTRKMADLDSPTMGRPKRGPKPGRKRSRGTLTR